MSRMAHIGEALRQKPQGYRKEAYDSLWRLGWGGTAKLFPFARGVGLAGGVALSERGSESYSDEATRHRLERRHAKAALYHIAY